MPSEQFNPVHMTTNGLLVNVRVMMTREKVSPEQFGELLKQTSNPENLNPPESVPGTLLLDNIDNLKGNSAPVDNSHHEPARGVLLIAKSTRRIRPRKVAQLAAPQPANTNLTDTSAQKPRPDSLGETTTAAPRPVRYLPVKSARKVLLLKIDEIDWIKARHNSVSLQVGTQSHVMRGSLNSFEQKMPGNEFVRISRSIIVHIDRIKELDLLGSGDCRLRLEDGTSLTLSRRYRANFHRIGLL
jgi:hypothetical protein